MRSQQPAAGYSPGWMFPWVLLLAGVDDGWGAACSEWVRTPGIAPPPRYAHAMAHDPSRGVVVLFGGISGDDETYHSDTWEFTKDGIWRSVITADGVGPSGRGAHAMAYDPGSRRLILTGGIDAEHRPLRDVWAYSLGDKGPRWERLDDFGVFFAGSPQPVRDGGIFAHSMYVDPEKNTPAIVGGTLKASPFDPCEPEYLRNARVSYWPGVRGVSWTSSGYYLLGGPLLEARLSGPTSAGVTVDTRRGVPLILGGVYNWEQSSKVSPCEYQLTSTRLLSPLTKIVEVAVERSGVRSSALGNRIVPGTSVAGLQRQQHVLCYDPGRDRIVVFGGINAEENLALPVYLEFKKDVRDEVSWEAVSGDALPQGLPPGRSRSALVHFPERKSCVLFGGTTAETDDWPDTLLDLIPGGDDGEVLGDTWELVRSDIEVTGSPPGVQTKNVCDTAVIGVSLAIPGDQRVTYSWRRNDVELADDGRVEGSRRSELRLGSVRYEDEGYYVLRVTVSGCGETETRDLGPFRLKVEPMPPWLSITTNGPDNRVNAGMVFDESRGVCVLFGGEAFGRPGPEGASPKTYFANDTWEWNGTVWRRIATPTAPSPRSHPAMVYDSVRRRTVLFGGYYFDGLTPIRYGDTWEWDGRAWERMPSAHAPGPRSRATAAFHPKARKVLLYGGDTATGYLHGEYWTWDGTDWQTVEGPPLWGYGYSKMIYDPSHDVCWQFGPFFPPASGAVLYPMFGWTGTGWEEVLDTRIQYDPTLSNGLYPDVRGMGGFYDPRRQEVVVFSHSLAPAGFVTFDGGRLAKRASTPSTFFQPPENAFAFDTRRRAIVTFGSVEPYPTVPGRTREVRFLDRPAMVRQPVSQRVPLGGTASFDTLAGGWSTLNYQWYRGNAPLADDGRIAGARTPTLTLPAVSAADYSDYRVRVTGACGETFSDFASLLPPGAEGTLEIGLGGLNDGEAIITWGKASAVLEASDNLTTWVPLEGARSPYSVRQTEARRFFRLRAP